MEDAQAPAQVPKAQSPKALATKAQSPKALATKVQAPKALAPKAQAPKALLSQHRRRVKHQLSSAVTIVFNLGTT